MTTFLTSDHHFGHQNIINFCDRPFDSVDEMNEKMIAYWNETVQSGDIVWYLGDFAMGKIADTLPIAGRLNGVKILVPGNHDRCWKGDTAGEVLRKWEHKYLEAGFDAIFHSTSTLKVPGLGIEPVELHEIHLNHFPFAGESRPGRADRFSGNRPDDEGQLLAHGHVHDAWLKRGRQVNVGVDVWDYRPVSLDRVLATLFADENEMKVKETRYSD